MYRPKGSWTNLVFTSVVYLHFIHQGFAFPTQSVFKGNNAPSITWGDCASGNFSNVDCGTIEVPVDYSNPDGDTITLVMARLLANETTRQGSMLFNPGGPGAGAMSAVFAAAQGYQVWSEELTSAYDIIAPDPRGTGESSPIKCDPELYNGRASTLPANEAEFEALVEHNKALSTSCRNLTGPVFDFVDTISAAKDLEMIRRALDDGPLNFYGSSYGTQLGETYAELFPDNVGRLALDGMTDHSMGEIPTVILESQTYETTLKKFFAWCDTSTKCVLKGKDITSIWNSIIANATKSPIPAPGCLLKRNRPCKSDVTLDEFLYSAQPLLTSVNSRWPTLSLALSQAAAGNATYFSKSVMESQTDMDYASFGIGCLDWKTSSKSYTDLALKMQMLGVLSPLTKGVSQSYMYQTGCIGWITPATNPQAPFDSKALSRAPPILLMTSLWDPETSVAWANDMKVQMPGSVMIVRNGAGHTSYGLSGETGKAMDTFLVNGTLPKDGTVYDS
jgi:pimeloyl-ACP methyl ester carboxylesterase